MNNQMMQFLMMAKKSGNPQQFAINLLKEAQANNPIAGNMLKLIQQGNYNELEQVVKNVANERGIDFNQGMQGLLQFFSK